MTDPTFSRHVDDVLRQTHEVITRIRAEHEHQMREQEAIRLELMQLEREVDLLLVQVRQERGR